MKSLLRFVWIVVAHLTVRLLALSTVAALSASAQTTTVVGWGLNNNGQTSPPPGLTNVVALSAGGGESVALRADGTVVNWGFPYQPPMPPGLKDILAIASGRGHVLALRSNGTVVAWGENDAGQAKSPVGLSNVVAVSGGTIHSLALKGDGTVVAWGSNSLGQTSVPPGLSNVIAVSAGGNNSTAFSLALKSDGTVVGWGDNTKRQISLPPGLSNVVAIAASPFLHSVALKSDGTVVAWGLGLQATNVPRGLSNVVAITAGSGFSLALRADGSVVGWGDNFDGEINIPASLRNVTAIASGWFHNIAAVRSTPPPWPRITGQPKGFVSLVGDAVTLQVTATASAPLSYRWQYRGQNLLDETNATLVLNDVQLGHSGDYAVIVSAGGLSVRSAPAFLAVSNRPVALPQSVAGLEDTDVEIELAAFDPSGLPLTRNVMALPQKGRLFQSTEGGRGAPIDSAPATVAGGRLFYVPGPDANGRDEFLFTAGNQLGDSLPAQVVVDVQSVNDPPGFVGGPDVTVPEDAGLILFSRWAQGIFAGPPDEASQSLVFAVTYDNPALFRDPPRIEVDGALTFTTAPDAYGTANLSVVLQDDGGTAQGGQDRSAVYTFTLTVAPVNDAPVARSQSVSVNEDSSAAIVLDALDADGDPLAYSVGLPGHGRLTGTPPNLVYRPAPDYFGPDSFSFAVSDGQAASSSAMVTIMVLPVNDPPTAVASASSPTALDWNDGTNLVIIAPNNSNALLILDASLSTDLEQDALEYLWFVEGNAAPLATGVRATNLFETGSYTLALQVFDGAATATAFLTLEVIPPGEAVDMLILQVDNADLERRNKRPLIASLKAAVASFDRGNSTSGINHLAAFQHKIHAQVARLDAILADTLIAATQRIIDVLQ